MTFNTNIAVRRRRGGFGGGCPFFGTVDRLGGMEGGPIPGSSATGRCITEDTEVSYRTDFH